MHTLTLPDMGDYVLLNNGISGEVTLTYGHQEFSGRNFYLLPDGKERGTSDEKLYQYKDIHSFLPRRKE